MQVALAAEPETAKLLGRLVAAVPGYALVVVGSSPQDADIRMSRGTRCALACTVGRTPYEFESTVLDARRTVVAGAAAWAIRTSFPSSLTVCQRRAMPRAPMAGEACDVFLSDYFCSTGFVKGEAVDLSTTGVLADFPAVEGAPPPMFGVGRSARVVFAVPNDGAAVAERVAEMERLLTQPQPTREPNVVELPSGGTVLDVPARVVRLQPGRSGGEAAALHFSSLPEMAAQSLEEYISTRMA